MWGPYNRRNIRKAAKTTNRIQFLVLCTKYAILYFRIELNLIKAL